MSTPAALHPDKLYRKCDPLEFTFTTTEELDGPLEITGQERALDAIRFSMGILHDGFNLFALGPNGTGKQTAVMHYLSEIAPGRESLTTGATSITSKSPGIPRRSGFRPAKPANSPAIWNSLSKRSLPFFLRRSAAKSTRRRKKLSENNFRSGRPRR